ncbi:hypothetical protein ACTHGU_17340 [Chitinophagaceae bacterium MMS25-I14]
MTFEDNKYLADYPGMYRSIFMYANYKVLIRFNAFMNDQLDIEFEKTYPDKETAIEEITAYIKSTRSGNYIGWSPEEIKQLNNTIKAFLADICTDKVELPAPDYIYRGNKAELKKYVESIKDEYVQYVIYR